MSGLVLKIEKTPGMGDWRNLLADFTNDTGTPLVSVTPTSRSPIAGEYVLTFTSVIAGTSATVHVQAASPDNPYSRTASVNLDGVTAYRNMVPGADVVFSSSGSFAGTWKATVYIGFDFGALPNFGASAGKAGTMRKVQIFNDDTSAARNVLASLPKHATMFATNGDVFEGVFDFAPGATELLTGEQIQPYHIILANVTGSGGSKTGDLKVEGATVNVDNVTTPASGTSVGLNVTDTYKITSGGLTDFMFQLSQLMTNSATANVLIENERYMRIAPDLGGAPGDFGTDDIPVTQDGQADGTIQPGAAAYLWVRSLVPSSGALSQSNPATLNVMITAEESNPKAFAA